jgi:hypothetical protein
MSLVRRIAGLLGSNVRGALRQAGLRQAAQLNCSPRGIIAGLAVMVATIGIWDHRRDIGMWVFLLAALAAITLVTLTIIKFLERAVIVRSPRRDQRSPVQARPVLVPPAQPGQDGNPLLDPDGAERPAEAERIQEPV